MAEPSRKTTTPSQSGWVRVCQWLWNQRGFLWGTVILGIVLNLFATWLITPWGTTFSNTPLGTIFGHPLLSALGGLGLLALTGGLWLVNRHHPAPPTQHILTSPSPELEQKNRRSLIKRVRMTWIEGLFERSLHEAARLELDLQERPDVLVNPWRLQVQELDRPPQPLPAGTSIVQVYDKADGELLILGEPGAGKTTLLLELARTLLDRAHADDRHPIPVVFNLSSWARKSLPLAEWLVEELKSRKYDVPPKMAQYWVLTNPDRILPLLDGLDEVAEEARPACVQAINSYRQNRLEAGSTSLVVCCRSEEYMLLPTRVNLHQAVSIQPLTDDQIERYLQNTEGQLEQLRQALYRDPELYKLVRRPLMLSIFTLAYQAAAPTDLPTGATQGQILQAVFVDYVERMLSRRKVLRRWARKQFLHWLTTIAKQLYREQQDIFELGDLQIDWLPVKQRRRYQQIVGLFFKPIFGWATLLQMGTFFGGIFVISWAILQSFGIHFGLRPGGIIFVVIGLIIGLYAFSENHLAEKIDLSHDIELEDVAFGLLFPFLWLVLGVVKVVVFVLIFGMPTPALIIWFVAGGLLTELLTKALSKKGDSTSFLGGLIQHFALRIFLWHIDALPWKVTAFLDEAAERLFLRKVGGGYIFVHRLLLEYFASLETTPGSSETVENIQKPEDHIPDSSETVESIQKPEDQIMQRLFNDLQSSHPSSDSLDRHFLERVLALALTEAQHMHKDYLATPHLLIALTELEGGCTQKALRNLPGNFSPKQVCDVIRRALGTGKATSDTPILLTRRCKEILQTAERNALAAGLSWIDECAIAQAVLEVRDSVTYELLIKMGINSDDLIKLILQVQGRTKKLSPINPPDLEV